MLLDSLLKTVGNTNDRRFQTIAERYLAQKNTQIQAAITLIKIGDSTAKHKAADILLRLNTPDLLIMLRLLDKQNVYLSLDSINVLANRSIQNKSLVENILDLGAKIGRENYQRWLIEVLKRRDDVKTVQLAINYAIRFEVTGQINLQDMPCGKSPEAIAAYLKWQY